jgi:hypothetical protein
MVVIHTPFLKKRDGVFLFQIRSNINRKKWGPGHRNINKPMHTGYLKPFGYKQVSCGLQTIKEIKI